MVRLLRGCPVFRQWAFDCLIGASPVHGECCIILSCAVVEVGLESGESSRRNFDFQHPQLLSLSLSLHILSIY